MTQQGKHTRILVDGYGLTAKIRDIATMSAGYDEAEVSGYGMDHSTMKLQGQGEIGLDGYFSTATGETHDAFKSLSDAGAIVSTILNAAVAPVQGDIAFSLAAQQINYEMNLNLSGVIAVTGSFKAKQSMPEFGALVADQDVTATGNTATLDQSVASSKGAVGILHLLGVSAGDTITVKIQDSPDGSAWADFITFTLDGSSRGAERLEISGSVDRYIRATYAVTGTEVSFPVVVIFIRK